MLVEESDVGGGEGRSAQCAAALCFVASNQSAFVGLNQLCNCRFGRGTWVVQQRLIVGSRINVHWKTLARADSCACRV